MNRITIFNLEWTKHSGLIFDFILLDIYKPFYIDASLFGVNVSSNFLYLSIFWKEFKVFDRRN